MAEIEDSEQEQHIDAFINYDSHYWIGLNDLSTEGTTVRDTSVFCSGQFKLYQSCLYFLINN